MTQITIDIPDELISRLNNLPTPVSVSIVKAVESYLENELIYLPESDLEDYQNFASQPFAPLTAEEKAIANVIIKQAWQNAQTSPYSSPEQIWSEFDEVRRQIKLSDTKSS